MQATNPDSPQMRERQLQEFRTRQEEHMARLSAKAYTTAKALRSQGSSHLLTTQEQAAWCACYAEKHCGILDCREAIYVATLAVGYYAIDERSSSK